MPHQRQMPPLTAPVQYFDNHHSASVMRPVWPRYSRFEDCCYHKSHAVGAVSPHLVVQAVLNSAHLLITRHFISDYWYRDLSDK